MHKERVLVGRELNRRTRREEGVAGVRRIKRRKEERKSGQQGEKEGKSFFVGLNCGK